MARHHRHRAELSHGAGVAQQHAVQQAPFDIGQGDPAEHLPAVRSQRHRRLLILGALLLHQRDQLTGDEGEGDEQGGQHDARQREDDMDVMGPQPRAEPALQPEHQHVDQAGDHRRHREGQIDDGGQQALAPEVELRDAPGGADADRHVDRHADRRHQQGQADRGNGVGLRQRVEIDVETAAQRLAEHHHQRREQEQQQDDRRRHGQGDTNAPRLHQGIKTIHFSPSSAGRRLRAAWLPRQAIPPMQSTLLAARACSRRPATNLPRPGESTRGAVRANSLLIIVPPSSSDAISARC